MFKQVFHVVVIFSLLFLTGCNERIDYSDIPEITMSDRQVYTNPTVMIVGFTDGDGDIGLNEGDTLPPYEFIPDTLINPEVSSNKFYYNLLFYYYENIDGSWVEVDLIVPYFYRIPVVTPTGQNKALKGEIEVEITFDATTPDSIRFEIELIDRALHISNRLVTPTIFI
jgi:hypothetical protein